MKTVVIELRAGEGVPGVNCKVIVQPAQAAPTKGCLSATFVVKVTSSVCAFNYVKLRMNGKLEVRFVAPAKTMCR